MTHIDLEVNKENTDFKFNLNFNTIFHNSMLEVLINFNELKIIVFNDEFKLMKQANESVLALLMSWKGKNGN